MPDRPAIKACLLVLLFATSTAVAEGTDRLRPDARQNHVPRTAGRWQPKELDLSTYAELIPDGTGARGEAVFSLADLEQIALENHPAVGWAAAQLAAARGRWLQVGLPPNPRVGYLGTEVGHVGRAGQQGAFVQQRFITGGKLALNRAVASREIQQLEQRLAAARQRVLTDVRSAFYEVLAAQESLDLARNLVGIGNEGVDTAEQLLAAQEVSRVDLLLAKTESASAANLLTAAENRIQAAWRTLAALLAMSEMPPARLEGQLDGDLRQLDWPASLERLLTESPELAAAWADVERARYAVSRAVAEPTPDVTLQGAVQYDDDSRDTIASVQVGLPLPIWNRNEGAIRRARGELAAAKHEVARLELLLQQRLAAAFERYQNARRQVERYRDTILPLAEESLRLIRTGYTEGEFGYVYVLTAQRTYFQKNVEFISSLVEWRRSATIIDGLLLDGSLEDNR